MLPSSPDRSPGPRRVRVSFGVCVCPSTERREGSGTAAFLAALRLCYHLPRRLGRTLGAWRGCDATRAGGQGCDQRRVGAAPCSSLLRGFGMLSSPRPRAKIRPGLGGAGTKHLPRSSAYAASKGCDFPSHPQELAPRRIAAVFV